MWLKTDFYVFDVVKITAMNRRLPKFFLLSGGSEEGPESQGSLLFIEHLLVTRLGELLVILLELYNYSIYQLKKWKHRKFQSLVQGTQLVNVAGGI